MITGSHSVVNLLAKVREHNNLSSHDGDLFVNGSLDVYPSWAWFVVSCHLGRATCVSLSIVAYLHYRGGGTWLTI